MEETMDPNNLTATVPESWISKHVPERFFIMGLLGFALLILLSVAIIVLRPQSVSVEEKKADILSQINSTEPLTSEQKEEIFDALQGQQITEYNFTEAEKLKLLRALNGAAYE
jgi:cell division protein FtsL